MSFFEKIPLKIIENYNYYPNFNIFPSKKPIDQMLVKRSNLQNKKSTKLCSTSTNCNNKTPKWLFVINFMQN